MARTFILAATLAVALSGCREQPPQQAGPAPAAEPASRTVNLGPDSPQLSRLQVDPVARARTPLDVVVAPGRIEANPNRISRVLMPVPGRIREVYATVGQAVARDQKLLAIESPDAGASIAELDQAQAAEGEARALVLKAEADVARIRDLLDHRAVAQKELVAAEAALAQSEAELQRAKAGVGQARRRLDILGLEPGSLDQLILVRAPLPGKVLEINVAPGEYRTDTAAALMVIADLDKVYMTSEVPESLIRLIHVGEQVEVRLDAFPDEVLRGRVALIADVVNPGVRTIEVRTELSNPEGRFRPQMFGRMVHEETFVEALVVPPDALIHDADGSFVFRELSPGVFEPVLVKTGRPGSAGVPVLEGLAEGDRIVTRGAVMLRGAS